MIKVLAFLESNIPTIEPELNKWLDKYTIQYVWSTNSRLVFILKEKASHHKKKEE